VSVLRRLLRYFIPYRGRVAVALLAMALVALSSGALLYFFRSLFDDVLTPAGTSPVALRGAGTAARGLLKRADVGYAAFKALLASRGLDLRIAVPVLLFAALLAKNVFSYLSEYAFNGIGLAMVRDLRADAYDRLLRQSSRFFTDASTGDLMSRLLGDVELVQGAFGTRIADLFQGVLTILVMLVYVLSLNPRLTFFSLIVAPLLVWPVIEISRKLGKTTFSSRERMGEIGEILQETIRGHRVVKTYGMESFESSRFREANERYFRVNRKAIRIQALSSPLMEILSGAGLVALFAYAARRISSGAMSTGDFLSFLLALLTMYGPIKAITKVNLSLQQAISSASRVFALMDRASEVVDLPGAPKMPSFASEIRFDDVGFGYDDRDVLQSVNLTIRKGETVALVGPSGAGKTTLANLLPRLYDVTSGSLSIDGRDVRDVAIASLRAQIAIVTQETILFSGTARSNIAYGRADAPQEAVLDAARAARADEFLSVLPGGYDSSVGENAARLSGGQRQRLAIARAIFKNAPILILDEATSQLDSESEAAVAAALAALMQGKTTLVIAHRLSTVRRADRIIVLESGRVVEQGSHAELLRRDGPYRRLHDMQYFDAEATPVIA
jgi:subfamily B ATP-binding cassette protein MsbA